MQIEKIDPIDQDPEIEAMIGTKIVKSLDHGTTETMIAIEMTTNTNLKSIQSIGKKRKNTSKFLFIFFFKNC